MKPFGEWKQEVEMKAAHTPGFPVVRLGERSIRIPLAGLQQWIAEHGSGSPSES